jgi:hypothetical protein
MRRPLLRSWLGTSLLSSVVALGCLHTERGCPTCGDHVSVVRGREAAPQLGVNPFPAVAQAGSSPYGAVPAVTVTAAPSAAEQPPAEVVPATHAADPEANDTADKVEWHGGGWAARTGPVPRRTFTDITAHPAFGHAPDYSWLVGSLDYVKSRQAWCLRYASVDEDDRYGGTVTLVDAGPMTGYRSGQLVRVTGEMVDRPVPGYRVRALAPLQQP